jgi:hypothetical protein
VRAFQSAGSADLSVKFWWCWCWLLLPVYDRAKMWPVYSLIVALTDFLSLFYIK